MITFEEVSAALEQMPAAYMNQEAFLKANKVLGKHASILMFIILFVLEDGSFHIKEIEKLSNLKRTQFYLVKKKLIEKGTIMCRNGVYYLNPIFTGRGIKDKELNEYFIQFNYLFE